MLSITIRSSVFALATIAAGLCPVWAGESVNEQAANDRLMIVSANRHRVIYDDGRDDLFCVTRRYVVGYDESGYAVHRRSMRCR